VTAKTESPAQSTTDREKNEQIIREHLCNILREVQDPKTTLVAMRFERSLPVTVNKVFLDDGYRHMEVDYILPVEKRRKK